MRQRRPSSHLALSRCCISCGFALFASVPRPPPSLLGSMHASAMMTPRMWMDRCDGCANRIVYISSGMWWFRRRTRSLWESLKKRPESSRAEMRGIPTRRRARRARGHCSDESSKASRSLVNCCSLVYSSMGMWFAPPQLGVLTYVIK